MSPVFEKIPDIKNLAKLTPPSLPKSKTSRIYTRETKIPNFHSFFIKKW
jgi:hypothetical protein